MTTTLYKVLGVDNLIGAAEAARLLGVNRSTITRKVRDGYLKPVLRMRGETGAMLFDPADILAHAQQQQKKAS